jgi:hypothetical protein
VSHKEGFDPAFHHKALGDEFAPGVHDPEGGFSADERAIADRLQEEGWRVDARPADHTVQKMKNPESMVRRHPGDEGRITEYKTLSGNGGANNVKRNINDASQVPDDGELVVDGRNAGVTAQTAAKAYARAVTQEGAVCPAVVHIILGDGRIVTYVKEN